LATIPKSSALAVVVAPPLTVPPTTSVLAGMAVAVKAARATPIGERGEKLEAEKSSADGKAVPPRVAMPPAIRTWPLASKVAVCWERAAAMDPVGANVVPLNRSAEACG
jgi:hypothetical protein